MAENTEEQFIVEGIRRYGQAMETLKTFETMLQERLREVYAFCACRHFKPSGSEIHSGTSDGAFGHIVWASQEGRLRGIQDTAWLELGMWWRANEAAYYCGFAYTDNKPIVFTYTRTHPRVVFKKWSTKPRLFMLISQDPSVSIDSEFQILLDELAAGSFA